jgi:hypothetical protein
MTSMGCMANCEGRYRSWRSKKEQGMGEELPSSALLLFRSSICRFFHRF